MKKNSMSFDTRIRENVKNYDLDCLYDTKQIHDYIRTVAELLGIEVMVTNRDGDQIFCAGNFREFNIDVVGNPGRKIKVKNRTVSHLYVKENGLSEERKAKIDQFIDNTCELLAKLGEMTYMYKESSLYIDDLEESAREDAKRRANAEKMDPLTGVYNQAYFKKRMEIIDRSEVAPVAIIEVNINDWRYANDNFGDEGSDRLIRIVADIIKNESKPEYVSGRIDGDVFAVLIPMPEEGEPEEFISALQKACNEYDDPQLTPSVACGTGIKENVEEKMEDKLSDAEYAMFENKLEIKASIEYQRRLHRSGV